MSTPSWPALSLADWQDTNHTIHLMLQIVGKVRLALHPPLNHWWHVTFYVSPTGLTTGPIPYQDQVLELAFDFQAHQLIITSSNAADTTIDLTQHNVARFYEQVRDALAARDIPVTIQAKPYDMPHITEETFSDCAAYDSYDPTAVATMHQILVHVNNAFQIFRGRFNGKTNPVHLYWHHFDVALGRYNGARAPERESVGTVDREAYSHEVISFGFWFGDQAFAQPAFYAYGYPMAEAAYDAPLAPEGAMWGRDQGMALLPYDAIRQAEDPQQALLSFLESTYQACANAMGWDVAGFDAQV